MKKLTLAALLVASFGAISVAHADDRTATAIASWDAKAIKDTQSMLVVTPLKSLTFNYAEGQQAFNTLDGAFDVTIAGQSGATDFKLASKIISSTLARSSDDSTLEVGVKWNGEQLSKDAEVVMIDTATSVNTGLTALTAGDAFGQSDRVSALGQFNFNITSASLAGAPTTYKDLTDGLWDGNVNVEFIATWSGTFI
ncbi:common pilus major fimbrillin subunit EcpA [Neisseriaceae bacterium CLB008]